MKIRKSFFMWMLLLWVSNLPVLNAGQLPIDVNRFYYNNILNIRAHIGTAGQTFKVCASNANNTKGCDFIASGTDDQITIQKAIEALSPVGGSVLLSEGTFTISGEVHIDRSYVVLEGQGYSTLLITNQPVHIISVRGENPNSRISNVEVRNLRVVGSGNSKHRSIHPSGIWTGPTGIEIMFANWVTVEGIWAEGHPYDGIGIPQGAAHVWIQNNVVSGSFDDGINPGGSPRIDPLVEYIWVLNNEVFGNAESGIHVSGRTRKVVVANNMIWNVRNETGSGGIDFPDSQDLLISGNVINLDGNTKARGIWGRSWSGGDSSKNIAITNNVIRGGRYAITIEDNRFEDVLISDNIIRNTYEDGVFLVGGKGVVLQGNNMSSVGRRAIRGADNLSRLVVQNNVIREMKRPIGETWTTFGVSIVSGARHKVSNNFIYGNATGSAIAIEGDNNIISGNIIEDQKDYGILLGVNSTSNIIKENQISKARKTNIRDQGSANIIRQNDGWQTENSGIAVIAADRKTVTVKHELNVKPSAKDIAVTPNSDLGSATKFWISDVDETSFNINVDTNPKQDVAIFSWQVTIY